MQEEALKLKTEELDKLIETSPFSSVSEALSFVLDEKKVLEYNLYVEDYNKKFSSATALRVSLSEQLSVLNFDLTEFMEKKKKHELITQSITEAVSMLGLYERDLLEATEKLVQAKEVLQRLADVNKKLGLCEKLEKGLDRRNLLNFIAEEYLSDISLNASTTLLMLTGGRYDLVYDGEFFVSDNYNCGERRSVSTLSGGETFLVSLALALSLSQAICEKTMRPMEFFFLDEGFGTLDSELTDVVIDSLEKLRSERFTIGLISHVPELKQRISSKINVFPATATEGSKIEVIS
jgi:exonuclease SbcC